MKKKPRDKESERGEQDLAQEKEKASLWVAMNSPAKEFSPLKALYISLCKPYQAPRMS